MSITRRAMRDEVQAMILELLTEGRWKPGERVSIEAVARELDVSPTPVREALVALEPSGLVEYRSMRGYVVAAPLTPEQIEELVDARRVIEGAALDRALRRDGEALHEGLLAAHRAHEEAFLRLRADPDPGYSVFIDYVAADAHFHDIFFTAAGNPFLSTMRDTIGAHIHRMLQTWAGGPAHMDAEEALAEHREILDRVEADDRPGALRALEVHLDNVLARSVGDADPSGA